MREERVEEKAMDTAKMELIGTACEELLSYGLWDFRTKLKMFVKKYMLGRKIAADDLIFWPTGLLAAGLWHCRKK